MATHWNDPTGLTAAWAVRNQYVTSRHGERDKVLEDKPLYRPKYPRTHRYNSRGLWVLLLSCAGGEPPSSCPTPWGDILFAIRPMTTPPRGLQSGDDQFSPSCWSFVIPLDGW